MKTESTVKYVLRIALTLLAITAVVAMKIAPSIRPPPNTWAAIQAMRSLPWGNRNARIATVPM